MTKDEALKMAIEFMETLTIDVGIKTWNEKHRKEAIQACKEALEQPKEKKYLYVYHENGAPLHFVPYRFANHTGYEYMGKIEVQND